MPPPPRIVTRRCALLGAAGVPLLVLAAGCTDAPLPDAPVDPDREALQNAYAVEEGLHWSITGWTAPTADDRRAALDVIARHVDALNVSLGGSALESSPAPDMSPEPSPTPTGSSPESSAPETTTERVRRSLDMAVDTHTKALRAASPEISPLLASIAASDAALAASLRGLS